VIATSTKVDISAVDVAKYSDAYFKREVTKKKKGESQFFEAEKEVRLFHGPIKDRNYYQRSKLLDLNLVLLDIFCLFLPL
jgi:hypothetical protein